MSLMPSELFVMVLFSIVKVTELLPKTEIPQRLSLIMFP